MLGASLLSFLDLPAGTYSPAVLLEAFLREVGPALSKVQDLALHLKDDSGSAAIASLLDESLALLASACPMLSRLESQGRLSQTFLRHLGGACPLLTELTIMSNNQDIPYLVEVLLLLPSLLPNVNTLRLPLQHRMRPEDNCPDMSSNTGLMHLYLPYCMLNSSSWQCLPPKLLTLECFVICQGPPANGPGDLLGSLLGLSVTCKVPMQMGSLAQLLRCAPNLEVITANHGDVGLHTIDCTFNLPTAAADLSTLLGRMEIDVIKNAVYSFGYFKDDDDSLPFPPFLAALPCMAGVERFEVQNCPSAHLGPLLAVFPDVRELSLLCTEDMGDVGLQALASCTKLTSLTLEGCSKATPIGLFALCTRLPGLCSVVHKTCTLLQAPALDSFEQLLQRNIILQEVVRTGDNEDEDAAD